MKTMIKSFFLFLLMLSVLGINAQVDGTLSTSLYSLQFSTTGLYHRIETNYEPASKTSATTQFKFGEPEIPVVQKKYLLPLDASGVSVQVSDTRTQALSGAYNIYPEQPPIPLNGGESPDWVEPKTEIYQSDEPYPGKIIEIGREASTMGYKIVTVNLYPVSYIPLSQTLELYTSIEFELQYTTGSENVIRPEKISSYRNAIVTDFIKSTVSNPGNTDSILGGAKEIVEYDITSPPLNLNPLPFANGSVPDYIIITSAEYNTTELQDFASWKTKKGISTVIVTLEQINQEYLGVDQAEKIFYYLKDVYNNWGSLFVLLGGDTDIIPARYAYDDTHINLWRPCELYFSDVDKASNPDYNWNANGNAQFGENGDHIDGSPDHFVGRAVFDNPDELNTFVDKSMSYEKAEVPGLDYYNNLLFMTGYLRLNDPDPSKPDVIMAYQLNTILNSITNNNANINGWRLYDDDDESSSYNYPWDELLNRQNALDNLNHGGSLFGNHYNLVYHMDHASATSMGTSTKVAHESMNRTDVDGLNNLPYSHIFYTGSCSPNSFDKDAIGDHYFNNENGAGVAFIGAASTGWSSDYKGFKEFCNSLYIYNLYNLIGMNYNYAINSYEGWYEYHKRLAFLGDPTLPIWTNTPENLAVSIDPLAVHTGENTINVTINNLAAGIDALVCIQKVSEVYGVEIITGTGNPVTVPFNCTPDTDEGNITVTITAKNYIPYETVIPVTINPGIHLYIFEKSLDDDATSPSNGNGDGLIDAGETTELEITLKNFGQTSSTNVLATLSCESEYITINVDESGFGNIVPSGESISDPVYLFTVDVNAPDKEQVKFDLDIQDDIGTYSDEFYVELHAAEPDIIGSDIETTNNFIDFDKIIDPGDHVFLKIDLFNSGSGIGQELNGVLTSESEYIENISVFNQDFGDIGAYSSLENQIPFEFDVKEEPYYTGSETIELTLILTDAYGKQIEFEFDMDKPEMITGLGFTSTVDAISLTWDVPIDPPVPVRGYNVYRSDTEEGSYGKINLSVIEGFSGYADEGLGSLVTYFYKVCAVSTSGTEGELTDPPLEAWTTLPYHANWPNLQINVDDFGSRTEGSPMTADFDADGNKEIYFTITDGFGGGCSKGGIFGFYHDGDEIFNIDYDPTSYSGFYKYDMAGSRATPVIGDLDNNNVFELVSTTKGDDAGNDRRKVFVHSTVGGDTPDLLWSNSIGGPDFKGAVLSDIDGNGDLEIIVKGIWGSPFYVFERDYSINNNFVNYPGWPISLGSAGGFGMPVAADINNLGNKEIIMGFDNGPNFDAGIYVFNHDATSFLTGQNGLFYQNGPTPGTYDRMDCPVTIADIIDEPGLEGCPELICVSGRVTSGIPEGRVFILNSQGNTITDWDYDDHVFPLTNSTEGRIWLPVTSVADVNGNFDLEILIASDEHIYIWEKDGSKLIDSIYVQGLEAKFIAPLIADVDEDKQMEIIVASNGTTTQGIFCYDINGNKVKGWPLWLPGIFSTPCIDDIDNDGKNEIIATAGVEVHVWDTEGDADKVEWGKYRHDRYNSGVYGDFCPKSSTSMVISSIEEWTVPKILQSDLIIGDQAKLTVYNNIALPTGAKIIIKPGGELILDGAILTKACKGLWQGIEVWGNPASAFPSDQGLLTIKNGALIENANVAIRNHHYNNELDPPDSYQGGIVKAFYSTFRNNTKAIDFRNYAYNSYNYIKDCEFIYDDNYLGSEAPGYFIEARYMKSISIISSDFTNNTSATYKGRGIYSYKTNIAIKGKCISQTVPCNEWENNTFNNLVYGIYAMDNAAGKYVDIRNSTFNQCQRGIYISGVDGARVTSNEFNVPQYYTFDIEKYGLYLNNATAYHVEDNDFFGPSPSQKGGIGVYVNNSGTNWNQIYNNRFESLQHASVAYGINRDGVVTGLCFKCNDYQHNSYDIMVNGRPYLANQGIARYQGSFLPCDTCPAGNTFSGGAEVNYYNSDGMGYLTYTFHGEYWGFELLQPLSYYSWQTMDVAESPLAFYDKEISCPSKLENSGHIEDKRDGMAEAESNVYQKEAQLAAWVDDGDTEGLNFDVLLSSPPEAGEVYQDLMNQAPFISDTVLKTAIYKEDVLINAMIRDVLVASPQSAKNNEILNAIDERFDPMPQWMKDQVLEGVNLLGAKEAVEAELSTWKQKRGEHFNNLYQYFRKDTLDPAASDSLVVLLANDPYPDSKYRLAFLYYQAHHYNNMNSVLGNIPSVFDLSLQQQAIHQDYLVLFDVLEQLSGNELQVDSVQAMQLEALIERDDYFPGAYARDLLFATGYIEYEEPITIPTILKSSEIIDDENHKPSDTPEILSVFPNPANDYVVVDYNAEGKNGMVLLSIIDLNGKPVFSEVQDKLRNQMVISTRDWKTGVYLVSISVNGSTINSKKLTIK